MCVKLKGMEQKMYDNWEELEQSISNCQKCKLCKGRNHIVTSKQSLC